MLNTRSRHKTFARALVALAIGGLIAQASAVTLQGDKPVIAGTTRYDELTIRPGQVPTAPAGKALTLTVDGISTEIAPGTYRGKVVLAVTDPILVKYRELPEAGFRSALYVEDNKVVEDKSVTSALVGGSYDGNAAKGVAITSHENLLNGIIVTGDSKYTLDDPVIELVGYGGNDFAGWGAAIMASGKAELTVNNPKIHTKGAVRTAVFVGGHSTVHVNNADIYTESGPLPPGYEENLRVGEMKEVPWQLSLSGNVRSTNLVDHATVYYTNSHIRSSGWGVLSVDDAAVTRMFVKDSLIETLDSGYGAYSIGDSVDTFDHSTLNVADYGLIIAGQGGGVFTNGSVVNSRRFGVMLFDHDGGGDLNIDKGTVFNTRLTGVLFKGRGGRLNLDNATINAGNGILVHAMVEDNPRKVAQKLAAAKQGAAAPAPAPIVGERNSRPMGYDQSPDVTVNLKNAKLDGDLLNTRTEEGGLVVNLDATTLHGAISTGVQKPITEMPLVRANFWQIGEVTVTREPTPGEHGATVALTNGAQWTVTKTSYLTKLSLDRGSKVRAPEGYRLSFTVDGKPTAIKPGATYQGKAVLDVRPL
ncbi:MAG: hypothetical protein QM601_05385 [Pseudoxanthomonas sp.]